jgi:hypothetical protein
MQIESRGRDKHTHTETDEQSQRLRLRQTGCMVCGDGTMWYVVRGDGIGWEVEEESKGGEE